MNITDEQWNDVSDALYEEMQRGINPIDERDKLKAQAAQLAEALREALNTKTTWKDRRIFLMAALAAYEEGVKP